MNSRNSGRAFQRTTNHFAMLPSPSVARARACAPSLRHPRVTTIAAIILLVACLYHARGFRPASPPAVERTLTPVSADHTLDHPLIDDGAGGHRVDDSERIGAGGPDITEGAGGPDISDGDGLPVIRDGEAQLGSPTDITDGEPVIHDVGAGGPDTSEGAGGPDITGGVPTGFDDASEKHQETDGAPAIDADDSLEAVVEKEVPGAEAGTDSIDATEKQEDAVGGETVADGEDVDSVDKQEKEDDAGEHETVDAADKQESVGTDDVHGDSVDSDEKQVIKEDGPADADGGEAIDVTEKQENMPGDETPVRGDSLLSIDKQDEVTESAADGQSMETSDKREGVLDFDSMDPAEKAAEGENDIPADDRQEGVAPIAEGVADAGGDYALPH